MRVKIKVFLITSLFIVVGCQKTSFSWNDSVITFVDGDTLAHYSLKHEGQQTRNLGHIKCALIDMTGSESLVSYDNGLIIYFDIFGKPNYIENSKNVVAVKILEKYLLVVSQFENYFVVSEYRKFDTDRGIVNQVKFNGLFEASNYINNQLLISYYSFSDKVSRIDQINEDLTRRKLIEENGSYVLYPIYYSHEEFIYSIKHNSSSKIEGNDEIVEIRVIDSKGIAYQQKFHDNIKKSVLINNKLYVMSESKHPSLYMFDMDEDSLKVYTNNVDAGAGLFNIQDNLVLINRDEIVVNNKIIKSLGESKIDTRYH